METRGHGPHARRAVRIQIGKGQGVRGTAKRTPMIVTEEEAVSAVKILHAYLDSEEGATYKAAKAASRPHGLRPRASAHAARAAAQAGRPRRPLRPSHRAPPADLDALPQRLASDRARARRPHRLTPTHPLARRSVARAELSWHPQRRRGPGAIRRRACLRLVAVWFCQRILAPL